MAQQTINVKTWLDGDVYDEVEWYIDDTANYAVENIWQVAVNKGLDFPYGDHDVTRASNVARLNYASTSSTYSSYTEPEYNDDILGFKAGTTAWVSFYYTGEPPTRIWFYFYLDDILYDTWADLFDAGDTFTTNQVFQWAGIDVSDKEFDRTEYAGYTYTSSSSRITVIPAYDEVEIYLNSTGAKLYIHNGTNWQLADAYIYNGSSWVKANARFYRGGW